MEQVVIRGTVVRLWQGDITRCEVDAVVNAANAALAGGGGVDGAIHRAGGPQILAECAAWVAEHGRLPDGEAMLTTAGRLPAQAVIHTVGPRWAGGGRGEPEALAACYRNALRLAHASGHRTVAFPSISTGAYGYPMAAAAGVAIRAIQQGLLHDAPSGSFKEIVVALFDAAALAAWSAALERFVMGDEDG
jgi:O-acetyl-ADP-ribose deacetylase (regulator of RNase III)